MDFVISNFARNSLLASTASGNIHLTLNNGLFTLSSWPNAGNEQKNNKIKKPMEIGD
jgi:hypothetical protein